MFNLSRRITVAGLLTAFGARMFVASGSASTQTDDARHLGPPLWRGSSSGAAQDVTRARTLAFEVASVKENKSGESEGAEGDRPGRYDATNVTLRLLVQRAYELRPEQLIGGPSWIESTRFDIAARGPAGTTPGEVPLMLRTLLGDRFKLRVRRDVREAPIYTLVVNRSDVASDLG